MEKRKEKISAHKVCRFCLTESEPLDNLYERIQTSKDSVNLHLKILTCVSIEVFPSDKMPCYICKRCNSLMNLFYEYKHIVRQADENILHFIQAGAPLTPIKWSSSLIKASKTTKEVIMKTVVEGGATVQVSSQDASDSEEEEEEGANVYNVKIGDGMDGEEKTACIKVVSAKASEGIEDPEPIKGFSSMSKLARHVRGHAGVRPYPCKFCEKSFVKSHHYTRHLRVHHRNETRASREEYRCEQCDITFNTQDELIYHSAIHATQSLTCPLCQERFHDVDAVTTHIKSHVTGDEFMCDFCELVFTSREKLSSHVMAAHEDEMQQDAQEESEGMEAEDEDTSINVKEVDENNMVIEIKKPDEFMIKGTNDSQNLKVQNTNSEESEAEIPPVTPTVIKKQHITILSEQTIYKPAETVTSVSNEMPKEPPKPPIAKKSNTQILDMVWSEEEPKAKPEPPAEVVPVPVKKEKPSAKVESSTGVGDKSLRLLEKELQDLKRTNSSKTPAKTNEANVKNRRPLHTSTPKLKSNEEKKPTKVAPVSKKVPTKENKEPKEVKEKEPKTNGNDKEEKESKENNKSLLKNGGNSSDKSTDEGIRRSTRPSKIKNYAKLVRDKPQPNSDDDTEDDDDEEYKEVETRPRGRRTSLKQSPKPAAAAAPPTAAPAATPRKRGRPRKDASTPVPAKVKKESEESDEETKEKTDAASSKLKDILEGNKPSISAPEVKSPPVLVYPGGQTLKKVPVKALPPGVKPLPLPANARPVTSGDLCEMQIGKKVVKVQKIVMTRAEVEAMAKKGLVEMKDGTMVLKQGIKIPTSDPANIKSTLVGETSEAVKEPSPKKEIPKAAPTRCDLEDV